MKYLLLALPLIATACSDGSDPRYSQGYSGGPSYSSHYTSPEGYGPSYSQRPSYASGYASPNQGYSRQYYNGENCGTPDQPRGCPPLPRRPLAYYPGDGY